MVIINWFFKKAFCIRFLKVRRHYFIKFLRDICWGAFSGAAFIKNLFKKLVEPTIINFLVRDRYFCRFCTRLLCLGRA